MGFLSRLFGKREDSVDRVIQELIETLRSDDEAARSRAAVDLHQHPSDLTVEVLIRALSDDSKTVRDNAAESLRVIAARGQCAIPVEHLLEAVRKDPGWWSLKECLRRLGFEDQVDKILNQTYTAGPKYNVRCMPFGCPHCGVEITRVPSWPPHGNMVAFYAQEDLYRAGAYHIELICHGCGKTVYIVWDEDPS